MTRTILVTSAVAFGLTSLLACSGEAPPSEGGATDEPIAIEPGSAHLEACSGSGCCVAGKCCSCDGTCSDAVAKAYVYVFATCPSGFSRSVRYTGSQGQFVTRTGGSGTLSSPYVYSVSQNHVCMSTYFPNGMNLPFALYCSATGISYPLTTGSTTVGLGGSGSVNL